MQELTGCVVPSAICIYGGATQIDVEILKLETFSWLTHWPSLTFCATPDHHGLGYSVGTT
jgi:hypothetical protein